MDDVDVSSAITQRGEGRTSMLDDKGVVVESRWRTMEHMDDVDADVGQ